MPVTLRAKYIGSLAAEALTTGGNSGIIGQVMSTFPNSFYVKALNGELLFVTNRSLRSPITLNFDSTLRLDQAVKPLDPVYSHGKEIQVAEISIDLRNVPSFRSKSSVTSQLSPDFTEIGKALRVICFLLNIIDTRQSVLDPRGLAHDGVAHFLEDGVFPLRLSSMEARFRDAALRIVGLGSGFTPSGDDTLGGFLATYNSLAQAVGRSPIFLEFPTLQEKTSWISAKLVDYMQRLILDEQMRSVIELAAEGDGDAMVLALETLFARGDTSGIDISVGTIVALSLVRDIAFDEEGTQIITSALGLSQDL